MSTELIEAVRATSRIAMFPDALGPVTMETVRFLEERGSFDLADIARKYAVDRPRWWHRFRRAK